MDSPKNDLHYELNCLDSIITGEEGSMMDERSLAILLESLNYGYKPEVLVGQIKRANVLLRKCMGLVVGTPLFDDIWAHLKQNGEVNTTPEGVAE